MVTAGPGRSLCVSPAGLRCPGRCHPCLASKLAPGMAQLPGAVSASPRHLLGISSASPQHLLGRVDFPATPSCLSPPSTMEQLPIPSSAFLGVVASLQEAAAWIIPRDCLRGHAHVPDSHQDIWAPSWPPADQRPSCQGAQSFLSQQLSFLPLTSLCFKPLDIPGFGHGYREAPEPSDLHR